jgi:hypothetical protein
MCQSSRFLCARSMVAVGGWCSVFVCVGFVTLRCDAFRRFRRSRSFVHILPSVSPSSNRPGSVPPPHTQSPPPPPQVLSSMSCLCSVLTVLCRFLPRARSLGPISVLFCWILRANAGKVDRRDHAFGVMLCTPPTRRPASVCLHCCFSPLGAKG